MSARVLSATVVPLPINLAEHPPLALDRPERLVIATFIRISDERPLTPLFEALAALAQSADVELRHYGRGDDSALRGIVEELGIAQRVTFARHSTDIRRSISDDGIGFVWMTAYDDSLGYASIELAAAAVPCCFYNVGRGVPPDEIARRTEGAINCFSTPQQLAAETLAIWRDETRYRALGPMLRRFVAERHDARVRVPEIEAIYEAACSTAGAV
jgi:glycosyltransferase involved in cell wall biosynthesis